MSAQPTPMPAEFHVFDTTLRDGSQQEGLNLSVADKLTIAAPSTSSASDSSKAGGRVPIRPTPRFCCHGRQSTDAEERPAGLVRLYPAGGDEGRRRPLTAALREARAPVACIVAKSHDRPCRAGAAHHLGREPGNDHRHRAAPAAEVSGSSSTANTSLTAIARIPRTLEAVRAAGEAGAGSSCSATRTAACSHRGSVRS